MRETHASSTQTWLMASWRAREGSPWRSCSRRGAGRALRRGCTGGWRAAGRAAAGRGCRVAGRRGSPSAPHLTDTRPRPSACLPPCLASQRVGDELPTLFDGHVLTVEPAPEVRAGAAGGRGGGHRPRELASRRVSSSSAAPSQCNCPLLPPCLPASCHRCRAVRAWPSRLSSATPPTLFSPCRPAAAAVRAGRRCATCATPLCPCPCDRAVHA